MSTSSWDRRWMQLCNTVASWSKDDSRKIGCVIVDERNTVMALGWNGLPRGVNDTIASRNTKPDQEYWKEHAERNAIYNAASNGVMLRDCIMYCSLLSCAPCCRGIIQCGIKELVVPRLPSTPDPKYADSFKATREMFAEAGVTLREIEI